MLNAYNVDPWLMINQTDADWIIFNSVLRNYMASCHVLGIINTGFQNTTHGLRFKSSLTSARLHTPSPLGYFHTKNEMIVDNIVLLWKLQSRHQSVQRQADGQTDAKRTDKVKPIYPQQLHYAGGMINIPSIFHNSPANIFAVHLKENKRLNLALAVTGATRTSVFWEYPRHPMISHAINSYQIPFIPSQN